MFLRRSVGYRAMETMWAWRCSSTHS